MKDELNVKLLKEGNDKAFKQFYEEYVVYFNKLALSSFGYIIKWIPLDDLIDEAFFISLNAINEYDEEKDASFKSFITLCVIRGWNKLYHKSKKSTVDNKVMVSLDDCVVKEEIKLTYYDILADPKAVIPSEMIKHEEEINRIFSIIKDSKIDHISEIINMRYMGYSSQEISEILNIPVRKINNSLYRVRKILKS